MKNNSTTTVRCGQVIVFAEFQKRRGAEERKKRNAQFANMIIDRWSESGSASGRALFNAILTTAAAGPIAPEQAEIILPVLLDVLDEKDLASESQEASRG